MVSSVLTFLCRGYSIRNQQKRIL